MLGERIRQLREERGMSVAELADLIDVPAECMTDVEEGRRRLSQATIDEIARIFGVPAESLRSLPQPADRAAREEKARTQEEIGRRIRELREQQSISLAELARRAGMSAAHLSEVERGLSAASLKVLDRIAAALSVSTAVLLGQAETDPLGDRVRRLRERMGLTQKELADQVGVSHALIGQVESGRLQPSVATLTKLAHALGVSPCYFLLDEEVGAPRPAEEPDLAPALELEGVRTFLRMLMEVMPEEQNRLLGLLTLLTEWRGYTGGPSCSVVNEDPMIRELVEIASSLDHEDKGFLLESARFVARKYQKEH